ncbi:MAG: hypothetical protein QQN61_08585 [Nitrosopumilus sp.]
MNRIVSVFGALLIFSGLAWLGLSIISTPDTQALTSFGSITMVIGIGLLVLSKKLGDREKKK